MWDVEYTDEFYRWWDELTDEEQTRLRVAVEVLAEIGPALGRPWVDTIKGSRHTNMKELRPRGGFLRVLFIFDPRRSAILLIGGDKQHQWSTWYEQMIPIADQVYDDYLNELRKEGLL